MLLQTNSYVVPKERRAEHARLLRRFRQALARLGCTDFEVYEQVGANWTSDQAGGRFVQIMRFRDRRHQLAVQAAEREDPSAQALVAEFCELINFPYQQENNLFAVGYYTALLAPVHARPGLPEQHPEPQPAADELPIEEPAPERMPDPGDRGMADSSPPDEANHDGNGTYTFQIPRYVEGSNGAQNHNGTPRDEVPIDPSIGQILDASLGDDQLDVALPAELIDPDSDLKADPEPAELPPDRIR